MVAAGKEDTLNVAVSRIPHPASIGVLALGEQTGSTYNLIPYGGGNPTQVAVLNGEADLGALPIAGVIQLRDQFKVLGIFNREENIFAGQTENAPIVNAALGTDIPDLYSSRAWAIHTDWAEANPESFKLLVDTGRQVFDSPEFKDAYAKTGAPIEAIRFGDREVCTEYAMAVVELAGRYKQVLGAD